MPKKSKPFVKKHEGNEVEGREECLREYVKIHDIDADGAETVKALAQIVDDANSSEELFCVVCGTKVRDEDTFCPFCGCDVSEDDTGGWDAYQKANAEEACTEEPGDSGAPEEPDDIETLEPIDGPEDEPEPVKKPEKKIIVKDKTVESETPVDDADYNHAGVCAPEPEPATDGAVDDDGRPLADRIEKVHTLETLIRKTGGEGAWDLGKELYGIHASKRFTENGFDTFRDFAEGEPKKGGLGMSYANAMAYIKVFKVHPRELAGQLGFDKAARLALAPEPVKKQLLKPQSDGLPLAAKLDRHEINERVKVAAVKAREERDPDAAPRGRPTKSKFGFLLDERKRTAKIKEEEPTVFKLDKQVAIEVLVEAKDGKVSIQFVSLSE
jgi:endogenous inhibitor of DNA gyrase (YacG/DUF329 family)